MLFVRFGEEDLIIIKRKWRIKQNKNDGKNIDLI